MPSVRIKALLRARSASADYHAISAKTAIIHLFLPQSGDSGGGKPFRPTDTAELRNGDIMILFAKQDEDMMRIGYVTRDELRQAIFGKGTLRPEIIAEGARRDGGKAKRDARYNIGEQTGLAIREDRTSGRIFVHMINDNYYGDEEYNLLSTFEWIAAGGESPG
ncbi:hypothetical protein FOZ62_005085, partial [Perkinsus olseni]